MHNAYTIRKEKGQGREGEGKKGRGGKRRGREGKRHLKSNMVLKETKSAMDQFLKKIYVMVIRKGKLAD